MWKGSRYQSMTALWSAAGVGHVNVIEVLLAAGANVNAASGN
jgi:ankyrin repeat protein